MNQDYLTHLMLCDKCYAPGGRYFGEGKFLKINSDADFFVSDLVKIDKKENRAAYMAKHCKTHFDMPALNNAIAEKYKAIKKLVRNDA